VSLALVSVLLLACGGSGAPDGPEGPATVAIGTGTDEVVLLSDGDSIDLIRGPQGGVMVSLGLHATGIDPGAVDLPVGSDDNPILVWHVVAEGRDSGDTQYRLALEPEQDEPTTFRRLHLLVQLVGFSIDDIDELVGAPIDIQLDLTDRDGRMASDMVEVLGRDPDAP